MTKVKAIETTDGQIFKDIAEAKKHELELLLGDSNKTSEAGSGGAVVDTADIIMQNAEKILNILTMKASSHPGARKANGATRKPRTVKPAAPATKPESAA